MTGELNVENTIQLRRCAAGLLAVEIRTEALFGGLRGAVRDHPSASAAVERYHAMARDHRDALAAHLEDLGKTLEQGKLPGDTGHTAPTNATMAPGVPPAAAGEGDDDVCPGTASRALRAASLACHDAAFGYGVLHETAHLCDSLRFGATLRLAERHLRDYARAAQEITGLLADVVAWDLRQQGQFCECQSPVCALGICWCIAHTTDTINTAWRETAPAYPSPGLRVAPNPRRPADLDVQEGDIVIAVDGHRVATTADVTTAVLRRAPGEPIRFGIERPSAGTLEITASRR